MLHGPQRGLFDLDFCLPSECADRLRAGSADIGILPAAELPRLDVQIIRGAGIACRGPIRSILMVSKVEPRDIRTLAADTSSRTSIQLARILLARNYGASPRLVPSAPALDAMLGMADAAVLIGDPALRVDIEHLPHRVFDLGAEWTASTGLPMVFAVWAGYKEFVTPEVETAFLASCRFGVAHLEDIVHSEAAPRGLDEALAREYLTGRLWFELGEREYQGLDLFLRYAAELDPLRSPESSLVC
jgi:predicted solute-binding protein